LEAKQKIKNHPVGGDKTIIKREEIGGEEY